MNYELKFDLLFKFQIELLEMGTTALCALLQAQPMLLDLVPSMGHIPRLCRQMGSNVKQIAIPKCAILILHALSLSSVSLSSFLIYYSQFRAFFFSQVCITAVAQTDCMHPLKHAMQTRRDMIAVACEALNRLFSASQEQLVKQALEADLVQYLLALLEARLELLENPAMTKAQIVKALKAMSRSVMYGDKICAILDKSTVWADYKDQKHDLFISNTPVAGYLTGISN